MSTTSKHPTSSKPVYANFASEKIVQGAGVAIFHLASERVVVCYHTRDQYWFLPKGRRNVGESIEDAACREGFEEVSFFSSLLSFCCSILLSSNTMLKFEAIACSALEQDVHISNVVMHHVTSRTRNKAL